MCWKDLQDRPEGELRERACRQAALRLRPPRSRPAGAGPLHLRIRWTPLPHFLHHFAAVRPVRRGGARGGRAYGDKIGAPGGHRPLRLAQWRRSSRIVLERNPGYREVLLRRARRRRRRGPGHGRALQGPALPLVDEVEISIIEDAAALAELPEREQDLIERVPAEFAAGRAQQPAGAQPGQEGIRLHALRAGRRLPDYFFNMETRWSAATSPTRWRCAAPSPGGGRRPRDPLVRRGQAIPARATAPRHQRLRPGFKSEMATSTRPRQGPAGPVRLRRPRRRRLARAARRPAAGARIRTPARPASRQLDELWKKNMKRHRHPVHPSRPPSGPST
jgi:hypothetical protein